MPQPRSLTPPEWIEIHRYWDKVEHILDHLLESDGRCGCDARFEDTRDWAMHLADELFPHRGVHPARPPRDYTPIDPFNEPDA